MRFAVKIGKWDFKQNFLVMLKCNVRTTTDRFFY